MDYEQEKSLITIFSDKQNNRLQIEFVADGDNFKCWLGETDITKSMQLQMGSEWVYIMRNELGCIERLKD